MGCGAGWGLISTGAGKGFDGFSCTGEVVATGAGTEGADTSCCDVSLTFCDPKKSGTYAATSPMTNKLTNVTTKNFFLKNCMVQIMNYKSCACGSVRSMN